MGRSDYSSLLTILIEQDRTGVWVHVHAYNHTRYNVTYKFAVLPLY